MDLCAVLVLLEDPGWDGPCVSRGPIPLMVAITFKTTRGKP